MTRSRGSRPRDGIRAVTGRDGRVVASAHTLKSEGYREDPRGLCPMTANLQNVLIKEGEGEEEKEEEEEAGEERTGFLSVSPHMGRRRRL